MNGERLKEIRESNNISRKQLAQKIYVTESIVQSWEEGWYIESPSSGEVEEMAEVFNMSEEILRNIIDLPEEENTQINKTVDFGVKKHQFSSEKILEDELVSRMESGISVFGFPLKVYQANGGTEVKLDGVEYTIVRQNDILAVDEEGNYYVIELKKDSGYDDAYIQTKAYVDWIQKHLAKSKHKAYGIICLNNPTKQLIEKVRNDDLIKLFEYNISYSEIQ